MIALHQAAARKHVDVSGFVRGLNGEQLHHLAEMRMQLRNKPAGTDQGGGLVLDQIRHDLNDRVFDVFVQFEFGVPGNRGFRIPLRGHGLCVQTRTASSDHTSILSTR